MGIKELFRRHDLDNSGFLEVLLQIVQYTQLNKATNDEQQLRFSLKPVIVLLSCDHYNGLSFHRSERAFVRSTTSCQVTIRWSTRGL